MEGVTVRVSRVTHPIIPSVKFVEINADNRAIIITGRGWGELGVAARKSTYGGEERGRSAVTIKLYILLLQPIKTRRRWDFLLRPAPRPDLS